MDLEERLKSMVRLKWKCMGCGVGEPIILGVEIVCKACEVPAPRIDGTCIDLIDPADAFKRLLESDYLDGLSPKHRAAIAARNQAFVDQIAPRAAITS